MTAVLERSPVTVPPPPAPSPAARLRMADIALLAALAGLVALLPLGSVVKSLALAVFVFVGPGAAVLTWVPIPKQARLAAIPTLGAALMTLVAIVAMWSYRWNTTGIAVLGMLAVAAGSVLWYVRRGGPPDVGAWPGTALRSARSVVAGAAGPPSIVVVAGLICWAVALPNLPGADASYYGLVASGSGRLLIPAMVLVTVGFVWAVVTRRFGAGVFAIAAAIAVLRVTTWAGTEMPLYDWTYKHVAVARYVQDFGLITPNGTDIYTQWPAFFVATAWFCDVSGLDPMTVAHLFAPLIHILLAVIVFSAARLLRQPPMTALIAVFVAEVANWVGQDYYSPQAWAIVLAFGLLVLLLASRGAPQAALLAILPFAAMVPSHQLTPFWVIGAAGLLVIFRCARPWWAVGIMVVIVGGYLALNLEAVAPYGIFSGGNPVANAASNVAMEGVPAKIHTSIICRGLSVGVFAAAAISALWAWRTKQRHVRSRVILAFCAIGLLLAQGYGGEAIFRIYLYSLLGCALLIAPAVAALLRGWGRGALGKTGAAACSAGLVVASLAGLYSFFALWPIVVESKSQVATMAGIVDEAEPGSRFMTMAASGMPTRSTSAYAEMTLANPYFDDPIELEYGSRPDRFPTEQDLGYLNWRVSQNEFPTYISFSPQSSNRMDYYGFFQSDSDDQLRAALDSSSEWSKIHDDGNGFAVYRHEAGKATDGASPG